MAAKEPTKKRDVSFENDEIFVLKGIKFKVVMMDYFTGHLGLRAVSDAEAEALQKNKTVSDTF
jgi:hypothetical protein